MIDKNKLLAWLARWRNHRNIVLSSVIAGLIAAVERGDLNKENEDE